MIRERADVVVLGAGFAGSLMTLVLERIGKRPLLLERGTHPRFAIGESSTPSANLALEELSRTYNLPRLFPFTEYGRWQKAYPHLACGLKRGFSFYPHTPGRQFHPLPDHANELLVAASPADEVGDTHWFREQFDQFLVQEVEKAGIAYLDRTTIKTIERGKGWRLHGSRAEETIEIETPFLIDATGPSGLLARHFGIDTQPTELHTNSWSIYSHFTGVERWENLLAEVNAATADHPYHCDDAALHHILADGWIWMLRFNNGVTSAGVVFDGRRRNPDLGLSAEAEWQAVMHAYPAIARQFTRAEAIQPWVRTGRLQRRAARVAGPGWAMLPHAAYFLDALFSTGIAHTMLGIERLARILGSPGDPTDYLADYQATLLNEIEFLDWLIDGCFQTFGHFDLLTAYSMYYFVAAHQSETRRRAGLDRPGDRILFSHHEPFRSAVRETSKLLRSEKAGLGSHEFAAQLHERVARDIAPFNPAGFCDRAKNNMYPFV